MSSAIVARDSPHRLGRFGSAAAIGSRSKPTLTPSLSRRSRPPWSSCHRKCCNSCWPAVTVRLIYSAGSRRISFGSTVPGWQRVAAIRDWVHWKVAFNYQTARSTKTAMDVFTERVGVCRDFQHLAITLTRCMNIPRTLRHGATWGYSHSLYRAGRLPRVVSGMARWQMVECGRAP